MNLTTARELAKEAWRHPRNAKEAIHPNLLESFAEILAEQVNKAQGATDVIRQMTQNREAREEANARVNEALNADPRAHNFTGLP